MTRPNDNKMEDQNELSRNKSTDQLVPEQREGTEMNAVEQIVLNAEGEAAQFFEIVKARLLNVNKWAAISGGTMSDFVLCNDRGEAVQRRARVGDHIRIDIPGPGPKSGAGYDWVKIENIAELSDNGTELLSMTARPAKNPLTNADDIAHFLDDKATSTFQVMRNGTTISAEEHGRNELANTGTGNITDSMRNTMVGWAAKLGLSYPQWKALVKGLLNKDQM